MSAQIKDITIDVGAQWDWVITYVDEAGAPINLTGYTAKLQVRESYDSPNTLISITSSPDIVLGAGAGTITISTAVPSTITALYGRYALEITGSGKTYRIIEGKVTFSPEVTK
jgi:hypothetical protein